jgi:hypothetical protein
MQGGFVLRVASVNQKPIRAIAAESKGFEIVFPRDRSFSGAGDIPSLSWVKRKTEFW